LPNLSRCQPLKSLRPSRNWSVKVTCCAASSRPKLNIEEWCERHLLARIHRYTVKRLRREIEPVALQDFMRFLFDWQHLSPSTRGQGSAVLPAIVGQFEGYAAAASAWDSDILPARSRIIRRAGWMTCAATANWCGRASARDKSQRHGAAQHADRVAAAQSGRPLECVG
jgi:hypothetical protein